MHPHFMAFTSIIRFAYGVRLNEIEGLAARQRRMVADGASTYESAFYKGWQGELFCGIRCKEV
jgi:hypothetical protein